MFEGFNMWQQLLIALALVLIIEGIMPFLSPRGMKQLMKAMSEMDENPIISIHDHGAGEFH